MANQGINIPVNLTINLEDIKKQGQSMGNILERALNKKTRIKALDDFAKRINVARNEMGTIRNQLIKTMNTPVRTQLFDDTIKQAQELKAKVKEIVAEYRKANPAMAGMSNKQIQQALMASKRPKDMIMPTKSFGLLDTKKTISDLENARKLCNDLVKLGKAFTIDDATVQKLSNELGVAKEKVQGMIEKYREMAMNSGNAIINALQPLNNFNDEIRQTIGSISSAFGPYIQAAQTAMSALVEVTKLEVKALATMGKVAISAFTPLVSLAKAAGKAISGIFSSIKKHNETTMKNLWRNILRYGIGVRSFYFLARKIRNLIGDIINDLAKQIPEVNAQMSAFKTAVNGLKGSLATAFQPILSAVLPALTALINAVSKAIAVIGKFIALLTGQNFVYAATATQVDYAKSLEKTGSAAKKAKKELEGYLSPIDEINKYQSKKDDDSGGGGDAGDFTLTKMPIEDWIKDFWDKIKQAWEHADFFNLGKMIGDKIAKMLANIPWAEIRAKARQLGRSLATLLNGIMYGEFNGKSMATYIGQTIAGAINTAFDFVDSYVSAFDFKKLGQSIMETLAGALDNLDWNLITGTLARIGTGIGQTLEEIFSDFSTWAKAGEALARAINALIYSVFNIFSEVKGAVIGAAISRFLNKFIEWIDSSAFVTTCNEIMRDMLDALIVAVTTTHWDELGAKLAEMFSQIDFAGIFKRYARLASVIIDAILDLLEEFLNGLTPDKLTEIGESIADAINNIDFQPKRLGEVANRLLQALLDIALEAVKDINWDKLASDISNFLGEIDWVAILGKASAIKVKLETGLVELLGGAVIGIRDQIIEKFKEFGKDIIIGLINGMSYTNPVAKVLSIFVSIIKAVKDLFGIHSPSTVFFDIATNIVTGFMNGIKTIVEKAKAVWTSLKTTTISIFNSMWNGIKGVINTILGGIEALVNGIINGFNKAIGAINTLSIDPPDWIKSKYGIGTIGFHIPTMNTVSIPRLAQGAVIPPNKAFMAMLGDQKSGTNIETPLQTMIDAFNTALSQNGGVGGVKQITFVLPDRREVAKYAIEGGRVIQTSTGRNPFELA